MKCDRFIQKSYAKGNYCNANAIIQILILVLSNTYSHRQKGSDSTKYTLSKHALQEMLSALIGMIYKPVGS